MQNVYKSIIIFLTRGFFTCFSEWLPEALENKCANCSEKQRVASLKIIKFLYENKKDLWKKLEDRFDPQGYYVQQYYEEEAKRLGIA